MNRDIRNDHKVPVNVHKSCSDSALRADKYPPCRRKRTIQPRCKKHSAVFLHIQRDIAVLHHDLRIALNSKGRRIQMTGCNLKPSPRFFFWNLKGNHSGAVPHDKIPSARNKLPLRSLLALCIPVLQQHPADIGRRIEPHRTLVQKLLQILCHFRNLHILILPFRPPDCELSIFATRLMPSRKTSPAFQRAFHIIANSPAWIPSGLYNCGRGERCKQEKKLPFVRFSGTCYTTSYEKKS